MRQGRGGQYDVNADIDTDLDADANGVRCQDAVGQTAQIAR